MVKLSANENCYGCSQQAMETGMKLFGSLSAYPDMTPDPLKQKIADKYNVNVNNVVVGAGSVRIIEGLIQTFVAPDEEVLTFDNTFTAYSQLATVNKRR